MVINDEAITKILWYTKDYYLEPTPGNSIRELERRSYTQWAVNEILDLLMDHPCTPPCMVIEEFLLKMWYAQQSAAQKFKYGYRVVIETAEHILALIN